MNFCTGWVKNGLRATMFVAAMVVAAILVSTMWSPAIADESNAPAKKSACPSLLNHHFMTLQGEKLEFCQFSGKVLLVVKPHY